MRLRRGRKKVGFGIEVVAEYIVGIGDGFLDGAVGQDDLEDQDVDAIRTVPAES